MMKRIVVCDSGLGGLNIASHFFSASAENREQCELIYFNAYPSADCGFNKLPSLRAQEEVFRSALEGMKKFSPDLCLVACNTLSIVYERLQKWYTPAFPVAGIVDAAVEGMFRALDENPGSSLLILGTKSTVESGIYARRLEEKGIAPERIKGLACPGLATNLESDPADAAIFGSITGYALKAAGFYEKKPQKLFLGLCCTHFGFASDIWLEQFSRYVADDTALVDPNAFLGNDFAAQEMRYYSKIPFFPGAQKRMSHYFLQKAPPVASALRSACIDKDLFYFNKGEYIS